MVQEKDRFAQAATGRATKPRPTIGFLTHSISDAYGELVWKGVIAAAEAVEANLICFPGWAIDDQRPFNVQANVIYNLISSDIVDGLVISGTLGNFVGKDRLQQFCKRYSPLPMASIAVELEGISSVLVANHQGMFDLVTHLIEEHGISHIAFISGPEGNVEAKLRYEGFVDALERHHLPLHSHMISPPTDWDEASGARAMEVLLDERKLIPGKDFQAVVTSSDNAAYGALNVLATRGICIPKDVVLTGFDAQERGQYLTPSLTTIRQPIYEQAYRATEMVLSQIQSGKTSKKLELLTKLIIRESCGCQNEEIARAKADITDKLDTHPKMALAVSKENILARIATGKAGFAKSIDIEHAKQLVQAFYVELRADGQRDFLNILDDVLEQARLASEDVTCWQEFISILHRQVLPLIDDKRMLFHAIDCCHQARVMIGERAQRIQGYRRIQAEERQNTLDAINQGLLTTSNEKDLMNILAERLPKLGIPSCYISQYRNPVVPNNGCHLILAYNGGRMNLEAGQEYFPSQKLVPTYLLPKDRPYSLVIEPLYLRENQIGLAVFEAGPSIGIIYETLRGQLSGALWAARLGEYLRSLNEASGAIMSLREPKDILQTVVQRVCQAAGAKGANVVILDKDSRQRRLAIDGNLSSTKQSSILMGTASMVSQVIQNNKPTLIGNLRQQASPVLQQIIDHGIEAAGCFPLRLRDKPIGAMWVYYEKPHHFSHAEENALQLYVNQAAIAYDNARRAKELEHLRQAAEKLATAADVQEVLHQIVKSAREVLEADSAVIWSYDMARKAFLPDELAADGIVPDVLEKYRADTPHPDGTAAMVMQRGYIAVSNIEDPKYDSLKLPARLRQAISVKSFHGIALRVDDETLGVLYVNYQQAKGFDEEDETTLKTFAYDAALALKKARLLERLKKVHEAARIVAESSVLKELHDILNAIAKGTQDALGCDTVSLYTYDEGNDEIGPRPAIVGVRHTEAVLKVNMMNKNSLIYRVLKQDNLLLAEDALSDPLVGGAFVLREGIKSSVSIPLGVGNSKVGAMFVNYRTPHHFAKEELSDIELFAHQAAVAIRNAQLYDDTKQVATYLQALYEAGNVVTSTLSLDEILNHIVEQASLLTSAAGGNQAHYCYLALKEDVQLRFGAVYSKLGLSTPAVKTRVINLEHDKKIGIVGRAIKLVQSQLVADVTNDPDYITDNPDTHSALAVLIKIGRDIIGAIYVEHPEFNAFDRDDLQALEALAAQAAIAIQNARQYDELKRTQGLVGSRTALAWMGMASNTWRHEIEKHALTIEQQVNLLRQDLSELIVVDNNSSPYERLAMLQRLAKKIKEKPITPPLSAEEGVTPVSLNGLIRERIKQLRENEPYKSIEFQPILTLDDSKSVWASQEWLRRALDILIDNGVEAMDESNHQVMIVETCQKNNQVILRISDTGKGIPEQAIPYLFQRQIDRSLGSKGLGIGLLMAQAIIQTYGGEIRMESTGPTGTTMCIQLPLEASRV